MTAIHDRFAILPIEAFYDELLTPAEFRMLAVLYSFRDKNANTVWPKLDRIADRAGYSDSTQVSRMTTKLEKKGWLSKAKKRGPRGPKIYVLSVPERIQLVRGGQVDYLSQVDNSEHEKRDPESQVDCKSQVDNLEPKTGVNLTATVNSQLDRHSQVAYEHTSIIKPITHQSPEPCGSAAVAALPVDNFKLPDLAAIYANPDTETEILNHGVPLLVRSGVDPGKARNFLQMLINKHKPGKVLDALIVCLIEMPVEPRAYLQAVLQKIGDEIPKDWVPPDQCLAELAGMGMPEKIYRDARDIFVTWFRELGIRHNNFPALFVRWCQRDWERADANTAVYLQRLRASAGLGEVFREPAGGTL